MNTPIMIDTAVADFLLAAQADGLRPASVKWYAAVLRPLADTFAGQTIDSISTALLRRYIVALRSRTERHATQRAQRPKQEGGLSQDSIAAHVRGLHRFWRWAAGEYGFDNPMQNIKRPARQSPDPKGISIDDLRALFAATDDKAAGARDRAILAFLIDTGCRAQGLTELKLEALDLAQRRAIVWEKGRRSRTIFYTDLTASLLRAWAQLRPANATTVFCSLSNRVIGKPLSYEGLTQVLTRLKQKAGVQGRVNPHSFRHGFARQYILNGGDLSTLSRLMGHSDSAVTAWYYAVFTSSELASIHERYSPLNGVLDDGTEHT